MKIKTSLLSLTLIFYTVTQIFAQTNIVGSVVDQSEQPVPYANVLIINVADSTLVKGGLSNQNGGFSIFLNEKGQFLLKSSFVGYDDYYSKPFTINSGQRDFRVDKIQMNESAKKLDDVVIEAKKPVFEQKIDRTVMNVASSVSSSGSSALDVLEKAPGITVDRSNYSMSLMGKSGVRVMINGKMSRMPVSAAVQMLEGMNAENVEKIELITTPPAKYEAEGDAGIIHIVLKQTADAGTNGSFSVFGGYGQREKNGGSINFNHRNKKFNIFGDYSFRRNASFQIFENDRILVNNDNTETTTITDSFRNSVTNIHNGRLGMDISLSKNTSIGGIFTFFRRNWEMDATNEIMVSTDDVLDTRITMPTLETNIWEYMVGNLNFNHSFNEKHSISAEADYINYDANNPTSYIQRFFDGQEVLTDVQELEVSKVTPIRTWVPRIDYMYKASDDFTLELGLKAALNELENDVEVNNIVNNAPVLDTELSQDAFLDEDISAAYASVSFKASEKLDIKTGLRYEHTRTLLTDANNAIVVDRNFGKLFPSLFLNKTINKDNSWVLSYSRRISRPTFRDIAPFVIFMDPNTFWTGNESLLPATTDAFRAEYRYKSNLFSFQYSRDTDAIVGFQPRIDEENQERQLTSSENLESRDNYSLTIAIPITVNDWWDMSYNLVAGYTISNVNHLATPVRITNTNMRINASNTFKLPKSFTIELSGFYSSPQYFGISRFQAIGAVNFGIEKKFNGDWGSLRLSGQDIFDYRNFIGMADVPEENINIRRSFLIENQVYTLTYTKSFGNKKLKRSRKNQGGSQEEIRRL